jgi:predicted PurR-regulated permease PerM
MQQRMTILSQVVMALLILAVLMLKLVPGAITGFLVYSLTQKGAAMLMKRRVSWHVKPLALAFVISVVTLAFVGIGLLVSHFLNGQEGLSWVLLKVAAILDQQRSSLPAFLQAHLPASVDELKLVMVNALKEHGSKLSEVGMDTVRTVAHIFIGLVIGALIACVPFGAPESYHPLSAEMLRRLCRLREAFDKVVFAQVKISALNTSLTAVYLLILLPAFGVHLPLATTLIFLTFVAGLIPVAGNLISNTIICLISLGVSFQVALASLGFLIFIHKLEYFVNARIVGIRIEAAAWELILSMVAMEALFGLPGLVIAPVLYAYLKRELRDAQLIGHKHLEVASKKERQG